MKKIILFMTVLFASLTSISQSPTNAGSITQLGKDTLRSKTWLIDIIESYFNLKDVNAAYAKMRSSLTSNYYNYKQDAINLEYDAPSGPPMTPEKFKKKWEGKYNIKLVGYGGFFISEDDHGKVKVISCHFIKQPDPNSFLFKVVIEDQTFKKKFNRDMKVIKNGNSFLIDDVMEYN